MSESLGCGDADSPYINAYQVWRLSDLVYGHDEPPSWREQENMFYVEGHALQAKNSSLYGTDPFSGIEPLTGGDSETGVTGYHYYQQQAGRTALAGSASWVDRLGPGDFMD